MKIAVLLFAVFLSCNAISDEEVNQKWINFQKDFGKSYKSPMEARARLIIFRQNLEKIEAHNDLYQKGEETWSMGITPFADWTSEEFLQYVNKYAFEPLVDAVTMYEVNSSLTDVPDSFDWRDHGAVSEVKNQGQCGSCWSFSTTGGMEGQYAISKGQQVSLSEQNLVDCAGSDYGCAGCNGGSMIGALFYAKANGIVTESQYPYTAAQGSCRYGQGSYTVSQVYQTSPAGNEDSVKACCAQNGPISVAIEATDNLQHYTGGVLYDSSCTGQLNHGVLVVGYGNQGGQDYWTIKNSWGAQWGEQGYFKLARNQNNNCGVATQAVFPSL